MINKYSRFIFDLDGTLYRGDNIIHGADLVINKIKELKKEVVFVSNKTTGSAGDYYHFMKKNCFDVNQEEIITAGEVIRDYLIRNNPRANFFMIGEERFINELRDAGFNYSEDPGKIDIVIVTLDRNINNLKIDIASAALKKGALFYAANTDRTCPVEIGEILDAGDTIEILEKKSARKLQKIFGKPSEYMRAEILNRMKGDLSNCLLIGDRIETDIAMGSLLNIDTAHVSTGITNYNGYNGYKPTYQLKSVADLIGLPKK